MRLALAQIDPTIGDLEGNARLILTALGEAREKGAELVVFPELAVPGYPPKDLLLREGFVGECVATTERIARACRGIAAIIGVPTAAGGALTLAGARGRRGIRNSLAFCADGEITHWYHKRLLPTYDVFDEDRYFDPGEEPLIVDYAGKRIGLAICEDLWRARDVTVRRDYGQDPLEDLARARCDLIVNPSASPFALGKPARQRQLLCEAARTCGCPVIYVNQVGGQDELIFSGNSAACAGSGSLLAHAAAFRPDLAVFSLDGSGVNLPRMPDEQQMFEALRLGVRDYCRKCGFTSAVLGVSGGIDSALVAVIAVAALGPERVTGVSMPSRYSSVGSRTDAQELTERLGMRLITVPIEAMHRAVEQAVFPHFPPDLPADETEENVQSRLRGLTLMAFSNKLRALLLTTGNKSEMAVGYCTLYGDMAGGLAVISDVPKTWVYRLARWINAQPQACGFARPPVPENTIDKPPSAELKPDQRDTDTLPPYEVLDEIIQRYVELEQSSRRIIEETGFDPQVVRRFTRLIDLSEYKRKQAPIGLKVTHRAFGFGRRFPIVQKYVPGE